MSFKQWLVILLLGLALVVVGYIGVLVLVNYGEAAVTVQPVTMNDTKPTQSLPTFTPTQTVVPLTPTPTSTSTPTATPTATPKVIDYRLDGTIDLASGLPVAIVIYKPDGTTIKSNWAKAIAYNDGDDPSTFDPHAGTVYSHRDGGFLATWIHSGMLKRGPLFGYELERSVWLNNLSQRLTLKQGEAKAAELLNSKVVLCQASADSKIQAFDSFDPEAPCPGQKLEFTITAASLINREKVDAYDAAVGNIIPWLIENEPGMGFESLKTRDGYLLQTCIGQYKDQTSDGTVDYVYNRLVIGLTLR